jgi:hypothetical protein
MKKILFEPQWAKCGAVTPLQTLGLNFFYMKSDKFYLKFQPLKWLSGKISFQTLEMQGAFIQCCCVAFEKDNKFTANDVDFRVTFANLEKLVMLGFVQQNAETYSIQWIEEEILRINGVSLKRSETGRLGGRPKAKESKRNQLVSKRKQTKAKESIEEYSIEEYSIVNNKEHSFENSPYFNPAKFKEALADWTKEELRHYYDALLDYSKQGKKYKDWAAAARTWKRNDKAKGIDLKPKPKNSPIIGMNDIYN